MEGAQGPQGPQGDPVSVCLLISNASFSKMSIIQIRSSIDIDSITCPSHTVTH